MKKINRPVSDNIYIFIVIHRCVLTDLPKTELDTVEPQVDSSSAELSKAGAVVQTAVTVGVEEMIEKARAEGIDLVVMKQEVESVEPKTVNRKPPREG